MDIEDSGNYRNDEEYELENLWVHHLLFKYFDIYENNSIAGM